MRFDAAHGKVEAFDHPSSGVHPLKASLLALVVLASGPAAAQTAPAPSPVLLRLALDAPAEAAPGETMQVDAQATYPCQKLGTRLPGSVTLNLSASFTDPLVQQAAWEPCDGTRHAAQATFTLALPRQLAAGRHLLQGRATWGNAAASQNATFDVPYVAAVVVSGPLPRPVGPGETAFFLLNVTLEANHPTNLTASVAAPPGWDVQSLLPSSDGVARRTSPLPLAVRATPPPGFLGEAPVEVSVSARPLRLNGSGSGSWSGTLLVSSLAPLSVALPPSIETRGDAAPPVTVAASRGCGREPFVGLSLFLDLAPVARPFSAAWGPCGPDGQQHVSVPVALTLPKEGLRAGAHTLAVQAVSEGRVASAKGVLLVPFSAVLAFEADFPEAVAAGEPFEVVVEGTVSANGPADLFLDLDVPAGWSWRAPPMGAYAPGEDFVRRVLATVTPGEGAGGAHTLGVAVRAQPRDVAGEPAVWPAQRQVEVVPSGGSFPWLAVLGVAAVVAVVVVIGLAAWAWLRARPVTWDKVTTGAGGTPTWRRARIPPAPKGARPAPEAAAAPGPSPLPRPPRYVNVALARGEGGPPLPKSTSLAAGAQYDLLVNVAGLDPCSVVENAKENPFRDDLLPPAPEGHWLDVVAVSDEFLVPTPQRSLFLPPEGSSYACPCPPGGAHTCAPSQREAWLSLRVHAPARPGVARIRLGVYHRNNLVQSQLLTAEVAHAEGPGEGHASRIDYQLTAAFTDVGALAPRAVHVLTNDSDPATHRLVIKGDEDTVLAFNLTEGQMRDAIDSVRKALADVHAEEYGGGLGAKKQRRNLLDDDNRKGKAAFVADLRRLAPLGRTLFHLLFEGRGSQRNAIRATLAEPRTTLQVGRTGKSSFVFPWALVYDIGLEHDESRWTLCPLVEAWDGRGDLFAQGAPPDPAQHRHGKNVLCPFGFWGYRHLIEQPPSMPPDRGLPTSIPMVGPFPRVAVGLSLELDEKVTRIHLDSVREVLRVPALDLASSRDRVVEALGKDLEIVYLYCHGRREAKPGAKEPIPVLTVGMGEPFAPTDIETWSDYDWPAGHWQTTPPLVFINGCHTVELVPEAMVSFVDSFAGAYAAGVLGTEVAMLQPMASEMGREFLRAFAGGRAGEALLAARLRFLAKGNLLGLAYTLYASSDLHLVRPGTPGEN